MITEDLHNLIGKIQDITYGIDSLSDNLKKVKVTISELDLCLSDDSDVKYLLNVEKNTKKNDEIMLMMDSYIEFLKEVEQSYIRQDEYVGLQINHAVSKLREDNK